MTAICATTGDSRLNTAQTIEQFLSATEKRAYRMAVIATSNRDDALEIVQDAMMKLVSRYGDKQAEDWGPLFHRILQSTIRDWYRRNKIRNGVRQFFFGNTADDISDSMDEFENQTQLEPGQHLKQQQAMTALDKALHNLPLRQQQAFLLRQWEGLNVNDTAQAMGCSAGSVKTHLSRAIAALRNELEDHWP